MLLFKLPYHNSLQIILTLSFSNVQQSLQYSRDNVITEERLQYNREYNRRLIADNLRPSVVKFCRDYPGKGSADGIQPYALSSETIWNVSLGEAKKSAFTGDIRQVAIVMKMAIVSKVKNSTTRVAKMEVVSRP